MDQHKKMQEQSMLKTQWAKEEVMDKEAQR